MNVSLLDVRLRISVLVTHLNTTERLPETLRANKTATTPKKHVPDIALVFGSQTDDKFQFDDHLVTHS